MSFKPLTLYLLLFLLGGCSDEPLNQKAAWQQINGREGKPVYRAKVPHSWQRKAPQGDLLDTARPLVKFIIDNDILITVHNFPGIRIPPQNQVMRWKKQTGVSSSKNFRVHPISHGGFAGLEFESKECLAWAMQMDPDHYQKVFEAQMKADYTIKAIGPQDKLPLFRDEIIDFALSFELIEEIPQ